jgi:hypothetical protein
MAGILLDNWTIERITQCISNENTVFLPEVIAFIEILVLWDDIYYFENGFSTYWQNHSMIDNIDIKDLLKSISFQNTGDSLQKAEFNYYKEFCSKYTSLVAKGTLEYMNIANYCNISYMPFDERAKFVKENDLYFEFKQYYNRHDAIHALDKDVFNYYADLNDSIRKANLTFNPNIIFSAINRQSSSFKQMIEIAKEWSQDSSIREFKNWVSKLENDISNFKNLKIQRYEKELEEIEQNIIRGLPTKNYSLSAGVPFSVNFAMNFPSCSNKPHLLFPMSLYLDAVSDNAVLSALKKEGDR